jgi:hypothetical protein
MENITLTMEEQKAENRHPENISILKSRTHLALSDEQQVVKGFPLWGMRDPPWNSGHYIFI